MKQALILHGTDASPAANWFSWLRLELEKLDYKVWLPQLPDSDKPNVDTYNQFLLSNPDFKFNNETIVIGHSSGAVEILSLLEQLKDNETINTAILVSAFRNSLGWESLDELFIKPFDFEKIQKKAGKFVLIHSDNDPYCPIDHPEYLADKLGAELIIKPGQGHFNTEIGPQYKQFPDLLDIIKNQRIS